MQDDRGTVEHTATTDFNNHQHLPQYLDGIFIRQYKNKRIQDKVVLNQKTRMRTVTFPSIKNARQFHGFVDELVNYVNALKPSDFFESGEYTLHHRMVSDGTVTNRQPDPLEDFISPKILDKLSKDKYSGPYHVQILLLHNYSIPGNTEFTTDIHFYTHHRSDIFNLIWKYISEYNSFNFYDGIYFLDFSVFALNSNFELVDFKSYSKRIPSEFLYGYDEIRVELKPMRKK
jgi:hypothetical protein